MGIHKHIYIGAYLDVETYNTSDSLEDILPDELEGKLFDPIHEDNRLILIGNIIDDEYITRIDETKGAHEITNNIIVEYIENFKKQYNHIITILKTKVNKLEIKFGSIEYWI